MSEPKKTSHWNSLAETLGAKVPQEASPAVEPAIPVSPPPEASALPSRRAPVEKPKPVPRKSNWGEVASVLGLAPPPEPKPVPVPEPPFRPVAAAPDLEGPARREPIREPARQSEPREPDRSRHDEARDASRTRYNERREEAKSRPSEPSEWDTTNDDDSMVESDELSLGEEESSIEETSVDLELVDEAGDSDVEAAGEGGPREEGEQRPRRRRRRRGRRQRRPEGEEARAPGAGQDQDKPADGEAAVNSAASADSGSAESQTDRPRVAGESDDRPRKKRRRGRGRSRSGKERPPPRRPAPDESARDEEAAFITETGGADVLDADFGPDDDSEVTPRLESGGVERRRTSSATLDDHNSASDDAHEGDDDLDDGDLVMGKKHKVPSWQETIGILVDSNLSSRGKSSPGNSQRGGRGRGRGRGR